jgi:hypothetical protein
VLREGAALPPTFGSPAESIAAMQQTLAKD